jgi:sugar lactone lactonase YvrE
MIISAPPVAVAVEDGGMTPVEVWDRRRCTLGEGPVYDPASDTVFWVDILGSRILWRRADGSETGAFDTPGHPGAVIPRAGGGFVLCLPPGPALRDEDGGTRPCGRYADADAVAGLPTPSGGPALRSNDAKPDPRGRLWLGTMAYDESPGAGALYRLDPGAPAPVRVVGDVTVSNGLGWSPDGTRMYYVDSPTRRVDVFDYDASTGDLADRRQFVAFSPDDGFPDGLCVDALGGVWVALWDGGAVRRYTADGSFDREVVVGTPRVTSCAFAGAGLDWLVITTARVGHDSDRRAGLTYRHRPGDVVGSPVPQFGG